MKLVRILNFSGLYFPTFGLNTDIYRVNHRIHFECERQGPEKFQIRIFFMQWESV